MPRHSQICLACKHVAEIIVAAGVHPPCPKCGGETERLWSGSTSAVHGDDIPGGMWVENGFSEPIKVYSHSEHERRLAAEGCEIRAMNRGENDKICKRWDVPSATTLENAKALLERGAQAVRARRQRWTNATTPITVTEGAPFRMSQDHE